MSLINRIAGIPEQGQSPEDVRRIPVDFFWAYLYELAAGVKTQADVVAVFELDAGEQADLTWLVGRYNAQPNATAKAKFVELMRVIFILAEANDPDYMTGAQIAARIQAI